MRVHAQVLTSVSSDTPGTTLLLHFDSKRYVFGQISEGTQRAFQERGLKLSKVSDIFLTGPTDWHRTGGLAGVMLAMGDPDGTRTSAVDGQDFGGLEQQVHGGENLLYTLATMRRFIFRTGMKLKVTEHQPGDTWTDENVVVKTLHIRPQNQGERQRDSQEKHQFLAKVVDDMFCSNWTMNTWVDDPNLPAEAAEGEEVQEAVRSFQLSTKAPLKGKVRAPWPASTIVALPETTPNTVSLCYIVMLHPQRGKFLPKRAKELGVKPGPDFSKLSSGQSVVTADGNTITPEDVMEPTRPGTGIAVCDLPSVDYIPDFLASEEWKNPEEVQKTIGAFFWMAPKEIIFHPTIQDFMEKFNGAQHIISSPGCTPDRINFKAAAKASVLLNKIDADMFLLPLMDSSKCTPLTEPYQTQAHPGLQWQIEPKWDLGTSHLDPEFNASEIVASEGLQTAITSYRASEDKWSKHPKQDVFAFQPELITLGTGSSAPGRHRNVSGTLFKISANKYILIDCGDGTLGQIKRLYPDNIDQVISDINVIYISHLHADHHLGSVPIIRHKLSLMTEAKQDSQPFTIIGPRIFLTWMTEYFRCEPDMEEALGRFTFLACEDFLADTSPGNQVQLPSYLQQTLDLIKVVTVPAHHCLSSFCVVFHFTSSSSEATEFKLAYSGDTRPLDSFVEISKGVDLLLHEATFEDSMLAQAKAKKHSTVSEALDVGGRMGATTVLTHFSQRYCEMVEAGQGKGVVVAFDGMRVKLGWLGRWEHIRGALGEVFKEDETEEVEEDEGNKEKTSPKRKAGDKKGKGDQKAKKGKMPGKGGAE
ncbi:beta-lactamase-like protein [Pyronema domesticum]|nr:beta-lactamase-like protein [Pyronema domesticum]